MNFILLKTLEFSRFYKKPILRKKEKKCRYHVGLELRQFGAEFLNHESYLYVMYMEFQKCEKQKSTG